MQWIDSTVRVSDEAPARFSGQRYSAELVARATQWVWICADFNAKAACGHALRLYRPSRSNGRKVKDRKRVAFLKSLRGKSGEYARNAGDMQEVTDHPALALLNKPNLWQTGLQMRHWRYMYYGLCGESYLHLDDGAYMLMPQYVGIQPDKDGYVTGYWYGRDRSEVNFFPAENTVHFRVALHHDDPYHGVSPLHATWREADIFRYAADGELARFVNGGRPDFMVALPAGTTDAQKKQVETELAKHKGVRNTGRFLVTMLEKIVPLNFSPKDMEYVVGQERVERVIWASFGIPEPLLRMNEANLAASETAQRQYGRQTLLPLLTADADNLTCNYLPMFGVEDGAMWFAPDNPVPEDENAEATRHVALVGAGIELVNEARADIGLPPLDGGDVPRINGQTWEALDRPPPAPIVPVPGDAGQANTGDAGNLDRAAGDGGDVSSGDQNKSLRPQTTKDDKPLLNVDAVVQSFENALRSEFAKLGADLKFRGDGSGTPDLSAMNGQLEAILGEHLDQILRLGIEQGSRDPAVTADFLVPPERALEFLQGYRIRLARELTGTLEADLRDKLRAALDGGATLNEALAKVQAAIGDESAYRAERIARTETSRAMNAGHVEALKEAGVTQKKWITAGGPCDQCEPLDNKVVSMHEDFAPGVAFPPLHPNCRCACVGVHEE